MSVLDELKRLSGNLFVGAAHRPSEGNRFEIIDPATEQVIGDVAECTTDEIEEVIRRSNAAQKAWQGLDFLTRAELLHEVATRMRAACPDLAEFLTRESGKPYKESADEVGWSASAIDYYAEIARHENGRVLGSNIAEQFHFTLKEPLGTVVIVLPFNFPYVLLCWEAAAALVAGNSVIVKPSEMTSLSSLKFMEAFASLPDGVIQCVTGGGAIGEQLVASSDTHMVAFTGGVETGRVVAKACAEQFKRCLIEASGNDPFVVIPSAPIDLAARAATFAANLHCGQVCTSAERLYVHESIHDAFVERLAHHTGALRIGNGLDNVDVGPMVSEKERQRYETTLARAVD